MKFSHIKQNIKCLPFRSCVICEKPLDEVGGKRIISQKLRGIALSNKYRGGGNKDYPYQSFKVDELSEKYVVVWGERNLWSFKVVQRAIKQYQLGTRPWFCQVCGVRICSNCGMPINYPMGSDVIDQNGCISHFPIFGFNPGCINKKCGGYRLWRN